MVNLSLSPERTLLEGIHGTWHYHLADPSGKRALCGAKVMLTKIPETSWNFRAHLKERYCSKCAELRREGSLPYARPRHE
jgi:hypothetical protein